MITEQEHKVIEISADLWNEFRLLPELHADDTRDFRFHIHAIQNIILSRSAYREIHPEIKQPE